LKPFEELSISGKWAIEHPGYSREYRRTQKFRERQRKYHKWYFRHLESARKRGEKWRREHPEYNKEYFARSEVKDKMREYVRKWQKDLKEEVFSHYSSGAPECACCGEMRIEFLTIDHIGGGGNRHRKEIGGSSTIYLWLKRNNYPPGFRVLCFNCNFLVFKQKVRCAKYPRHQGRRINLRLEVLYHYSNGASVCKCCGEGNIDVLTIHHVGGGGLKHLEEIGGDICGWLKRNNYPPGFQVLCWNCNEAKAHYGFCPHEIERAREEFKKICIV
jgi:hypothetical protein